MKRENAPSSLLPSVPPLTYHLEKFFFFSLLRRGIKRTVLELGPRDSGYMLAFLEIIVNHGFSLNLRPTE